MKSKIMKLTVLVTVAFILLATAFTAYFYQNTEAAEEVLSMYIPKAESVMNDDGSLSYVGVVLNNLFACAMCIGMGLVPFLFLPVWAVISNGMMIGVVLGYGGAIKHIPILKTIIFGLLPHGIFELLAFFLSMAMGIYLCRTLALKLMGRAKDEKILSVLNSIAKTFVLVVIPLVIVAAVVECTITPALMNSIGLNG